MNEKISAPWSKIAYNWKTYNGPPSSPTNEEISFYKDWSKKYFQGKGKVLLLGATPEIRNMLGGLNVEVTICDVNLEMILAMTELAENRKPDEIIVKASWIDVPLEKEYYDVILGDGVVTNIMPENHDKYFAHLHDLLRSGGAFITRIPIIPKNWAPKTAEQIMTDFPKDKTDRQAAIELYLLFSTYVGYDPEKKLDFMDRITNQLKKWRNEDGSFTHPNKDIEKILNNPFWKIWLGVGKVWSLNSAEEIQAMTEKYFKIMQVKSASDHRLPDMLPVYEFKKE